MDACRRPPARPAAAPRSSSRRSWARASGQAPRVCTVSRRGGAGDGPQRDRVVEPERDPGRERAAADLDDDPVEGRAGGAQLVRRSPRRASRRPRSRGRCPGPWQVNGIGAVRDGLLEAQVRGVAGLAGQPRAGHDARAQVACRRASTTGSASSGTNTRSSRSGRPRDDRRGQRRVAAATRSPAAPPDPRRRAPPRRAAPAGSRTGGGPCASRRRCRSRP